MRVRRSIERILENELALKKDRVPRIPGVAAERVIGHREIDLREIRLDDLGGESGLRRAGDAHLVMAQNSRVVLEEPKRAVAGGRDVALLVGEQEEAIMLDRQSVGDR